MKRYALVALALAGPGIVAAFSSAFGSPATLASSAPFLAAFVALVGTVYSTARMVERTDLAGMGFRGVGLWTLPTAALLTLFFVAVFGPLAYAFVAWLDLGGFGTTINRFKELPRWYLALTIFIVASGEEWLYRGYAIDRLEHLTGSAWLAGAISLIAFTIVHLPFWEVGPTLTTLLSGAILTIVYIYTRDVLAFMIAHVATDFYGLMMVGTGAQ